MRFALAICLWFGSAAQFFAQTPTEPQFEGSLGAASYSGGYILSWANSHSRVTIYRPDAKAAYSNLTKDYAVWSVDSDGVSARASTNWRDSVEEGKIDLLDPAGKAVRTINTGTYCAQHMAFAPDHTLWTLGYDSTHADQLPSSPFVDDFNVVHHYARTGEELNQFLPWSQIAGDYNALTSLQLCLGGKSLFVNADRIGFYSQLKNGHGTWVEISTNGNLMRKLDLGDFEVLSYSPLAMTASGNVYARIFKNRQFDGWAVLDRSTDSWRKVTGFPKGTIIGSDGDDVIFAERDRPWTILHRISSAALRVEPTSAPSRQQVAVALPHE
jgi:hypothetical protein